MSFALQWEHRNADLIRAERRSGCRACVCESGCVCAEWEEDVKYSELSLDDPLQPWSGGFILTLQVIAGGALTKVTSEHHPLLPPSMHAPRFNCSAVRFLLRALLPSHSCPISLFHSFCLYLHALGVCLCACLGDLLVADESIAVL